MKTDRRRRAILKLAHEIAAAQWPQTEVRVDLYGPVGLCNRYWVEYVLEKPRRIFELNLEPRRCRRPATRDFTAKPETCRPDSITALNGLHYPRRTPPLGGGPLWYAQFLRKVKR